MLSTDTAISRLRRDLTLGSLVKVLMLAAGIASLVVLPLVAPQVHSWLAMLAVGVIAFMFPRDRWTRWTCVTGTTSGMPHRVP